MNTIAAIHRALHLTDLQVLGNMVQPRDLADDPTLCEDRTYAWLVAIGVAYRPFRIGEIGVRFGYGLACMAMGSISGEFSRTVELLGWDNEDEKHGVPGSLQIAQKNLAFFKNCNLKRVNTQELYDLDCGGALLDLIRVDGDHTYAGCGWDMELAWKTLHNYGVMLVDDYHFIPEVQNAVHEFSERHRASYAVLPTYRGAALFERM